MSLDLAAASNVLKEFYLPRLREQLNNNLSPTMGQLERSSQQVEGLEVVLAIHTGRSAGTGSRLEFADLPTADRQKYRKVRSNLAYHYGRVQFTGQVVKRAKSDAGSFVKAATYEMEQLTMDLKQVMNRQLFNDAEGSLISTSGTPTGQVVPVAGATAEQYRSLVIGMPVDIGTAGVQADGANSVVIASVDRVAQTITFTGNVTAVTNNMFVRMEDSFTAEITGLQAIVNSGDTLFSVDGATEEVWNSYVDGNGGTPRAPSELLLETALDEISIACGVAPKFAVASHGIVRNYGAQLTSQKRYNDTLDLNGGYKGLTVSSGENAIGLVSDRFATEGTIWMLNPDHLVFNEAGDWEWMSDDGAVLNRIPNKEAYEATMVKYCELTTDQRNAHGRIDDVAAI